MKNEQWIVLFFLLLGMSQAMEEELEVALDHHGNVIPPDELKEIRRQQNEMIAKYNEPGTQARIAREMCLGFLKDQFLEIRNWYQERGGHLTVAALDDAKRRIETGTSEKEIKMAHGEIMDALARTWNF